MAIYASLRHQLKQISEEGRPAVSRKLKILWKMLVKVPFELPGFLIAVPVVLLIRMLRPWILIRFEHLVNSRIGHFAANPELYLCEQDAGINVPNMSYRDYFYFQSNIKDTANQQLARMWKRTLRIKPAWIVKPVLYINRLFPGWKDFLIGNNTQHDRDVNNLLDKTEPHLGFTKGEEEKGEAGLRKIGIPIAAKFVCLLVRDSAYLNSATLSYHSYRDCNIQNYTLAAEALISHGYYVVRMGSKVRDAVAATSPNYIDYASNGMRTDFMDIYLGAKCSFCITTGAGWDSVPATLFRKPIVYTNIVPFGYLLTFSSKFLLITKKHFHGDHELTISEIFSHGVGYCMKMSDYTQQGVTITENTPEEIRDVALEMVKRIEGDWQPEPLDIRLQNKFWELFPADTIDVYNNARLHGRILSNFSASYLRENQSWIR